MKVNVFYLTNLACHLHEMRVDIEFGWVFNYWVCPQESLRLEVKMLHRSGMWAWFNRV